MPIPGRANFLVLYKNCASSMGIFKANGFHVLNVTTPTLIKRNNYMKIKIKY
jgi:hypothetical protein